MALMVSLLERQGMFATGQIQRGEESKGWRSPGRRDLLFQTEAGSKQGGSSPCPTVALGVRGPTINVQLGPSLALRSISCEQWDRFLRLCKGKGEDIEAHLDEVMLEAFVG